MTSLETRLRDELANRAAHTPDWTVTGGAVRQAVRRRRIRASAAAAVVLVGAATAVTGSRVLDDLRRPPPAAAPGEISRLPVTTDLAVRAEAAIDGPDPGGPGTDSGFAPVLAARLPGSGQPMLLLAKPGPAGSRSVWTVSQVGNRMVRGTFAEYTSDTSVPIAQPVRDGDGTVLVVLSAASNAARVTTSAAGGSPPRALSVPLDDGLALIPVPAPEAVTLLEIHDRYSLAWRGVPAPAYVDRAAPVVPRIVVAKRVGAAHVAQVRTNGLHACRVTAGSWANPRPGRTPVPWNPIDQACAPLDGNLQLLLPADSSATVAGVAPPAAAAVMLEWTDGSVTRVRPVDDRVPAFLTGRSAAELKSATALAADGSVIHTRLPGSGQLFPGPL